MEVNFQKKNVLLVGSIKKHLAIFGIKYAYFTCWVLFIHQNFKPKK